MRMLPRKWALRRPAASGGLPGRGTGLRAQSGPVQLGPPYVDTHLPLSKARRQMKVTVGKQWEGHRVGSCRRCYADFQPCPAEDQSPWASSEFLLHEQLAALASAAGTFVFTEATCCEPG